MFGCGTYPPEQVPLGGRVEDFWYLQVGVHAETVVFQRAGGGGSGWGGVRFVSLRSDGLLMGLL